MGQQLDGDGDEQRIDIADADRVGCQEQGHGILPGPPGHQAEAHRPYDGAEDKGMSGKCHMIPGFPHQGSAINGIINNKDSYRRNTETGLVLMLQGLAVAVETGPDCNEAVGRYNRWL